MSVFLSLPICLALSAAPAQPDTVRFTYTPQERVSVPVKNPIVVIDGELQPETFKWGSVDTRTISNQHLFTDSLTCATYGGRKATEEGLVYIITKKNASRFTMPKTPAGAKPASYSKFAALSKVKFVDPWSVECDAHLDALPSFGNGQLYAFYSWMNGTIIEGKDYLGENATKDDYGDTVVSFVVTEKGEVKDVKVLKKRTERFNAAMEALINDSPLWKPAIKDGKPVPVVVIYPACCFILIG